MAVFFPYTMFHAWQMASVQMVYLSLIQPLARPSNPSAPLRPTLAPHTPWSCTTTPWMTRPLDLSFGSSPNCQPLSWSLVLDPISSSLSQPLSRPSALASPTLCSLAPHWATLCSPTPHWATLYGSDLQYFTGLHSTQASGPSLARTPLTGSHHVARVP